MGPLLLRFGVISTEELWNQLLYTEALLLFDEVAKDLSTPTSKLVERAVTARVNQLNVWREETIAQAHIDARNYQLDLLTLLLSKILLRTLEDAGVKDPLRSPRYTLYFPEPVSRFVARALESQLQRTRGFPTSLRAEPEQALKDFAPRFEDLITKGDLALQELHVAESKRKTQRTQEIAGVFADANKERKSLAGKLSTLEADKDLPDGWANSFFRKSDQETANPIEKQQRAILGMLDALDLDLSREGRTRILDEQDLAVLRRWCAKAGAIQTEAELFS
jgi:hypothetical protein